MDIIVAAGDTGSKEWIRLGRLASTWSTSLCEKCGATSGYAWLTNGDEVLTQPLNRLKYL